MKTKTIFFLALLLSVYITQVGVAQDVTHPTLAKEIRSMRDQDQKLRKKWAGLTHKGKTTSEKYKRLTQKLLDIDSTNTARMRSIVDIYGWPNYSMVGKRASVSAWLLVQHADREPLFQIKCLPLLKAEADRGESDLVNYAYLYDRVQIAKGEKQFYATQSSTNNGIWEGEFQPIEDEAYVQDRRSQMGFDTHIREYAKRLGFTYVIPSPEEAIERADKYQMNYDQQVDSARVAMRAKDYDQAAVHYKAAMESYGSMRPKDLVETARAISLAENKDSKGAAFYLIKAALGGWKQIDNFDTDPDFQFIKELSPRNWGSLTRLVAELQTYE